MEKWLRGGRCRSLRTSERFGRSDLDLAGEKLGDRNGVHGTVGMMGNTNYGEDAVGYLLGGSVGKKFSELEKIAEHFWFLFADEEMYFDGFFETNGAAIIAFSVNARKTKRRVEFGHNNGPAEGAVEGVLGIFHVA